VKEFDVVKLPNGTQKIERVEFPDGQKKFDVALAANGTEAAPLAQEERCDNGAPAAFCTLQNAKAANVAEFTRTIVVDVLQPGPNKTWVVQAHDADTPNVVVTLLCSKEVPDCAAPIGDSINSNGVGDKFLVNLLPANDRLAYKHYPTWQLKPKYEQSTGPAVGPSWLYAIYQFRDPQGNVHEGRYPNVPSTSVFAEGGRNIDVVQVAAQTQDKTDEQAVCLQFIQRDDRALSGQELANRLPIPKVNCYEHVTYTHVTLTNPSAGLGSVRGIIVHDNRFCGINGCPTFLAVQGCGDYPGKEDDYCRNSWSKGMAVLGADIAVAHSDHGGWYDIVVTRSGTATGSGAKQNSFRYVGRSSYKDVVEIAREQKEAADTERLRAAIETPRKAFASKLTDMYSRRLLNHGADPNRTHFDAESKTLNSIVALIIETNAIALPANAQEFLQNSGWVGQAYAVGFRAIRLDSGRTICDFQIVNSTTIRPGKCSAMRNFGYSTGGYSISWDVIREWPKGYEFTVK